MAFNPDTFEAICQRIAKGEPLSVICREEGMPSRDQVYDWLNEDDSRRQHFARARKDGHDAIAEQCLEIADDEQHDWMLTKKGPVVDKAAIARSKLRVWTRLQLLAKWDPRYSEKLELAGSKESPLTVQVVKLGANGEEKPK